ncbi:NitT/TauT family transport system ATP-binding protein [Herbaspirillum sp. Sphag1AN]|uniref:ABC transporter ATP-binding protein n=1 Tax=unclassified Herbaspirillum TaxID=2624150 RepID=UPI001609EB41|nr:MULTISPECIES: ABC transporter ATP-binding protein [unclassified Herbaspirillum]MBB3211847.1 NitT/TauT family transport system ATP-binding protein [Herbaspirillum sp. Sphag1AN]MBB3244319.1 NitT/TauT family transport system ATP-binding protein [Herbaspirillum sp. Sphag64]
MSTEQYGKVDIRQLQLQLGEGKQRFDALQDISLTIAPGEFVCVLGPSGCGKSTLLGALAGHLPVSEGSVQVDGIPVKGPHLDRGLVFQHHTLFPWKRVLDNVAFGLKMQGISRRERYARAHEMLQLVGLADFAQSYPAHLSGGMQQRVEIARVLINHPRVMLMDEPFGALDAQTRLKMQELLLEVWARIHTTIMFITHDIDEALFLADRIIVMSPRPGRIIEELRLEFPRPRSPTLVTSPAFTELKRHCLALLHPETRVVPLSRLSPLGAANLTEIQFAI